MFDAGGVYWRVPIRVGSDAGGGAPGAGASHGSLFHVKHRLDHALLTRS
jgi:hypothetical protein